MLDDGNLGPGAGIPHRAVLSAEAVTIRSPDRLNAAQLTAPSCWKMKIWAPVRASHSRAVLSLDAVTMRSPEGLNAAQLTAPSCWKTRIWAPVRASHSRAVLS